MSKTAISKTNYSIIVMISALLLCITFISMLNTPDAYYDLQLHPQSTRNPDIDSKFVLKKWKFVWFQHIRKSGGTSMKQLFVNNHLVNPSEGGGCGPSEPGCSIEKMKRWWNEHETKVVSIEWYGFLVESYLKYYDKNGYWDDVLLVTILRNPIKRVWSDIFHRLIWIHPKYQIHKLYKNGSVTDEIIIDILTKYENKVSWTQDLYVKTFSGVRACKKGSNENQTTVEMHLEIAKTIIQRFDIILLLDSWDITSKQLECYGIKNTSLPLRNQDKHVIAQNMTMNEHPKIRHVIEEINKLDMIFYDLAVTLATKKTRSCVNYLAQQYHSTDTTE